MQKKTMLILNLRILNNWTHTFKNLSISNSFVKTADFLVLKIFAAFSVSDFWFLTEFNGALRLSSYKYTAECNYCLEVYKRLAVKGESGLRVTKGRRIQQKKVEDNPLRFSGKCQDQRAVVKRCRTELRLA